jgi:hypothetical protein
LGRLRRGRVIDEGRAHPGAKPIVDVND